MFNIYVHISSTYLFKEDEENIDLISIILKYSWYSNNRMFGHCSQEVQYKDRGDSALEPQPPIEPGQHLSFNKKIICVTKGHIFGQEVSGIR